MIKMSSTGNFKHTEGMFQAIKKLNIDHKLKKYGELGVEVLRNNTPIATGKTANSWTYEVISGRQSITLQFNNTNVVNGTNIAIIIQYGHGTGTGGYVMGRDYINPSLQPIFDKIADDVWREVTEH